MTIHRIRRAIAGGAVLVLAASGISAAQSPSASPVVDAPSLPGVEASPAPSVLPDPVFVETFDQPNDLWWTGRDKRENTRYAAGGLRTTLRVKGGSSTWQWVDLAAPTDHVRVEIMVLVEEGSGGGGPICGDAAGDGGWFWGGINGDGEWLIGRILGSRLQVADRGEQPIVRNPDAPVGAPYPVPVVLECQVDPTGGGDRVVLWVEGVEVADIVDEAIGPYAHAGMVTAGDEAGVTVWFDDLQVWDLAAPAATASPVPSPDPGTTASPAPAAGASVAP
jgi:hypothetical protein